jgi:hypothetical protein
MSVRKEIIGYNIYVSPTVDGTFQKLENGSNPNVIKEKQLRIKKGDKFGTLHWVEMLCL